MPGARRETASHQQHKEAAPRSVSCMVITCSDTRTPETDTSGALIMNALKERGHSIASYHLVKDEPSVIRKLIKQGARSEEHTSELQSRLHLVCRLLLEKKKTDAILT